MSDIIALDSQVLKAYLACPRMCKFDFVDKLKPFVKESYFDRGDLIHKMLAHHYNLVKANHHGGNRNPTPYENIIQSVATEGENYSTTLDLAAEECIRAIEVYKEYAEYYRGENWIPTHVEHPFSVKLHEDEDLTILWEGKVDLVVQHGIVDTKSSLRRGEPRSLDDQFIGYCFAMNQNNLIVNKVGFQASLKAEAKFERYTKSYPKALIEEWRQHVVRTVKNRMLEDIKAAKPGELSGSMYEDYRYTSCEKWGCRYYEVCGTEPELREWKIRQLYKIGEPWQPAQKLEQPNKPEEMIQA